jgi:hypothetical protein
MYRSSPDEAEPFVRITVVLYEVFFGRIPQRDRVLLILDCTYEYSLYAHKHTHTHIHTHIQYRTCFGLIVSIPIYYYPINLCDWGSAGRLPDADLGV